MGILSTLGIIINAFGFMLMLFPLYVFAGFSRLGVEQPEEAIPAPREEVREHLALSPLFHLSRHGNGALPDVSLRSSCIMRHSLMRRSRAGGGDLQSEEGLRALHSRVGYDGADAPRLIPSPPSSLL